VKCPFTEPHKQILFVWENIYDSATQLDDVGDALAIDANNNVMVACHSNVYNASDIKYVTTLRSINSAGELINTGTLDASDSLSVCNDLLISNTQLILTGSRWSPDGARDILMAQFDIQLLTEENSSTEIVAFPNPFSEEVNFNFPSSLVGNTYRINDTQGRMIISGSVSREFTKIDVSALAPGLYTIMINSDLHPYTSTFIKH
jgi:hypothetical protein